MDQHFYSELAQKSLQGDVLSFDHCIQILTSSDIEILSLIKSAFCVREHFWKKDVTIHILNNVQNGLCGEDCHYCAQSKLSHAAIETYPMKSDEEIVDEAKIAYESGAFRYCMVFSGKSQDEKRIDHLASLIKKIKSQYSIEVCVSPGFITRSQAQILKHAGLDRINHNINTSEEFYNNICTTHTFQKRMETLLAASEADLDICSGIIIGMGESCDDIIHAGLSLRQLKKVKSIPINFFLPIPGTAVRHKNSLTPEYCLRVLCLYRFLNPQAEIRMAAGREYHLRDMQVLGLYPANSLFMDGYLNAQGSDRTKTLRMIKDAGFTIRSEQNLDDLIAKEPCYPKRSDKTPQSIKIKTFNDLHPTLNPSIEIKEDL